MFNKWTIINFILVVSLITAGTWTLWAYQNMENAPTVEIPFITPPEDSQPVEQSSRQTNQKLDGFLTIELIPETEYYGQALFVPFDGVLRFHTRVSLDKKLSDSQTAPLGMEPGQILKSNLEIKYRLEGGGEITTANPDHYTFRSPADGGDVYLHMRAETTLVDHRGQTSSLSGETHFLLLCPTPWEVLPADQKARIGDYPTVGAKSVLAPYRSFYTRPSHYYRVSSKETAGYSISPHFKLGDFDLNFDFYTGEEPVFNSYPQYLVLQPALLAKCEKILEKIQSAGIAAETLELLAGFRSPAYNKWKGEQAGVGGKYTSGFSTHMYGAAVDFFVDLDGDGVMDDFDGDGLHGQGDADWIRKRFVDPVDCYAEKQAPILAGGCGIYPEHDVPGRALQTPNLHIDVRGYNTVRWHVNSADKRATDWQYWEKNPCP